MDLIQIIIVLALLAILGNIVGVIASELLYGILILLPFILILYLLGWGGNNTQYQENQRNYPTM
jgi:hypothetical protein